MSIDPADSSEAVETHGRTQGTWLGQGTYHSGGCWWYGLMAQGKSCLGVESASKNPMAFDQDRFPHHLKGGKYVGSIPHCLDYRTFGSRGLESKLNCTGLSQLKMQNHDATCAISENSPDIRYHYGTLTWVHRSNTEPWCRFGDNSRLHLGNKKNSRILTSPHPGVSQNGYTP